LRTTVTCCPTSLRSQESAQFLEFLFAFAGTSLPLFVEGNTIPKWPARAFWLTRRSQNLVPLTADRHTLNWVQFCLVAACPPQYTWDATREWMTSSGWRDFSGQAFHHWAIPQNGWGKGCSRYHQESTMELRDWCGHSSDKMLYEVVAPTSRARNGESDAVVGPQLVGRGVAR
jgi:hypothetical protein